MEIGMKVKIEVNGEWKSGTIVNVYVVPKDYNLADVEVDGVIIYGVETKDLKLDD